MTPGQRVRAACAQHGTAAVVNWCAGVLSGGPWDSPGDPPLEVIGGPAAGHEDWIDSPVNHYWPRVWAARALLYAWLPSAAPAVLGALHDEAWRVREMAAKVARLRELGEGGDVLSTLVEDEVTRVRVAAIRALALVGEAEHAVSVAAAQGDPEPPVRNAATVALQQMSRRLDRPL